MALRESRRREDRDTVRKLRDIHNDLSVIVERIRPREDRAALGFHSILVMNRESKEVADAIEDCIRND